MIRATLIASVLALTSLLGVPAARAMDSAVETYLEPQKTYVFYGNNFQILGRVLAKPSGEWVKIESLDFTTTPPTVLDVRLLHLTHVTSIVEYPAKK